MTTITNKALKSGVEFKFSNLLYQNSIESDELREAMIHYREDPAHSWANGYYIHFNGVDLYSSKTFAPMIKRLEKLIDKWHLTELIEYEVDVTEVGTITQSIHAESEEEAIAKVEYNLSEDAMQFMKHASWDTEIKIFTESKTPSPTDKLEALIRNIDFAKFREQKLLLLNAMNDYRLDEELNGIIHLIDAIQDHLVDEMGYSEKEIFNLTES